MTDKCFFDSNVIIYAVDAESGEKQRIARELLRSTTAAGATVISTQVLQEFFVAATRRLASPLSPESANEALRLLSRLPVVLVRTETVLAAAERMATDQLSLWHALIVEAALDGGCTVLYTEDLQDGRKYGGLTVVNPFM